MVMPYPKTSKKFTPGEFYDLRRTIAIKSETRRRLAEDPLYAADLPQEVSMQLTYKCNLRCVHCFQWNEQGFFHSYDSRRKRSELDITIVEDVLRMTAEQRAKLFLWGGEPLMHSRFGDIAALLERYPRVVNMCTNGLLMERNAEHLLRIGPTLNLLVSLDGFEAEHEALRGPGSFARTMRNVNLLLDLQRRGEYRGEISVACMVSEAMVGRMYEFTQWAEETGFNSVYWLLPWFISPETAASMDRLYQDEFAWLNPPEPGAKPTWHSYTYALPEELIPVLRASMAALAGRVWKVRLRYQPQIEDDEVDSFIRGTSRPAQRRHRCLAVSNRIEIHADGRVSSCKFFPEFVIGDLHDSGAGELWQSERFQRVRASLRENGLMPVCSKCILLYLNGD
jgi:radical SAM protein with 4Fe4S-binding SPASM domain